MLANCQAHAAENARAQATRRYLSKRRLAFVGLRWTLERKTQTDLAPYAQLVKLAPVSANITLTLP